MIRGSLLGVALALAATTLAAQAPKPAAPARKPATATSKAAPARPQKTESRYVPAIMQEKMITVDGCLKNGPDWQLTDATLAGQKEKTTVKLEGISSARLSLFVGKRVQATGALQEQGDPAGKGPARFEATAVQEATGSCS
jgi:hypothetical protein